MRNEREQSSCLRNWRQERTSSTLQPAAPKLGSSRGCSDPWQGFRSAALPDALFLLPPQCLPSPAPTPCCSLPELSKASVPRSHRSQVNVLAHCTLLHPALAPALHRSVCIRSVINLDSLCPQAWACWPASTRTTLRGATPWASLSEAWPWVC